MSTLINENAVMGVLEAQVEQEVAEVKKRLVAQAMERFEREVVKAMAGIKLDMSMSVRIDRQEREVLVRLTLPDRP